MGKKEMVELKYTSSNKELFLEIKWPSFEKEQAGSKTLIHKPLASELT